MKRDDLIAEIAASLGKTKKDTAEFVKAYEEAVVGAVKKGEDVALQGFMRIERKVQKPRKGFDFKNGKPITLEARERIVIRPGTALALV